MSLTPHLAVHDTSLDPSSEGGESELGPELYLDIASTRKTFGGEARLLLLADELVERFGWEGEVVLTDRPEWAAAFAAGGSEYFAPGKSREALFRLPIERLVLLGDPVTRDQSLRERRQLVEFLRKVGLRTIGQFAALGEAEVSLRFGRAGLKLHQWACGTRELKLEPYSPRGAIRETIDTDVIGDDLSGSDGLNRLLFFLRGVCVRFEARLRGRNLCARKITLSFHLDASPPLFKLLELTEPLRDASALLRTLRDLLSEVRWTSPLRKLDVEVVESVSFVAGQLDLFDESENRFSDLNQFVGRLRARFGADSVGIAEPRESHLPERSWAVAWPPQKREPAFRTTPPSRPLFLFTPPRPCTPPRGWRLTQTENLAVEWWEDTGSRSYFLAENQFGDQLWVYFDAKVDGWFLQGTFD